MSKFTEESYAQLVRENIQEFGYHLTYVLGDKDSLGFCYSTGITKTHGIPEIFISSLPQGLSADYVRAYVSRFTTSNISESIGIRQFPEDTDAPFEYYLIPTEADVLREYALASYKYYDGESFRYLQLVFPDTQMKFPHESGYSYDQEILGDYGAVQNS